MKSNNFDFLYNKNDSNYAILYCENETAVSPFGCVSFENTVLSNPPPEWIVLEDNHNIILTDPGFYCVFFCVAFTKPNITIALLLNQRVVAGTEEHSEENLSPLCGSAVISINAESSCKLELAVIEPPVIYDLNVTSGVIMISKFIP